MILKYPVKTYIQITQGYISNKHYGADLGFCSSSRWNDNSLVTNKKLPYDGVNHTIISPADGVVEAIRNDYATKDKGGSSYGNYVRINHGSGVVTMHAHFIKGSVCVKAGQSVKMGDKIGLMGTTGRSNGVHLHTEVRINGVKKDPLKYYSAYPDQALGSNIIEKKYTILYYNEDNKYNLTRTLMQGHTGNDVKAMQSIVGTYADGVFGKNTLSKVKEYQKSHNLQVDGKVGKNTAHSFGWLYKNK